MPDKNFVIRLSPRRRPIPPKLDVRTTLVGTVAGRVLRPLLCGQASHSGRAGRAPLGTLVGGVLALLLALDPGWSWAQEAQPRPAPAEMPVRQAPRPPAAPSPPAAPNPTAAPAAKAAVPQPQEKPTHALEGAWKVYWINENKTSEMRIGQVVRGEGLTNVVGSIATLQAEACPLTGTVVDSLTGQFIDGIETKMQQISAYVVLRAQCPTRQIWIEGFGMPNGRVLIPGRATVIGSKGDREFHAVGLGR
jgi:hypothetical protein